MGKTSWLLLTACLGLAPACGGGDKGSDVPDATPPPPPDAAAPDAPPPAPMIGEVLTCGVPGSVGGMAPGTDLERHDLDLDRFPEALCNDGTGAVIYFRPYEGDLNRDRWVIQLLGGGACGSGQDCANRWCSVGTNFSMTQMSSNAAPQNGTVGNGIFARRPENPIGDWNHVLVRYCSSDTHSGTARDVVLDAADPITGEPITFRMHFLGSRVVDAVIETLREPELTYTIGGGSIAMPDLDDAEMLLWAGASAGGSGTIRNIDRIRELLWQTNPSLQIRALIDSIFSPNVEDLDFSTSTFCTESGLCDYETFQTASVASNPWNPRIDESCLDWHALQAPGTEWQCHDNSHVIRNHLTTSMFVRMGQRDELISENQIEGMFSIPGYGLMDLAGFAMLIRDQLAALGSITVTAHEGASIFTLPGAFGPTCAKHETLRNGEHTFNVTIQDGGVDYTMFQVIANWITGGSPSILITQPGGVEFCPPTSPP